MNANGYVSLTALRTLPMFAALDDQRLAAVARAATMCRVDRREQVVIAGSPIDHVFAILAGQVKLELHNPRGRNVILYMLGQGEIFGEMEVIDDRPGMITVSAVDPTDMVVIGKSDFRQCMAENFEVARFVMHNLVRRLRLADSKIAGLAGLDVHGRVATLLQELSEEHHGRRAVPRRISRSDIARMVGASREMVSRVMRDLQTSGRISESGGMIWLHEAAEPAC